MLKPGVIAAAALPALLLASCASQDAASVQNETAEAEANALGNASRSNPDRPGAPVNGSDEPVPPPDAVSHPDGYLPPVDTPSENAANSPGSSDPPATEDEYMRNKQAGR